MQPGTNWSAVRENSGVDLRLDVRTATVRHVTTNDSAEDDGEVTWGEVPWLDQAKLKSLGFPLSSNDSSEESKRHERKLLPKDVYVVLELNGPSYRRELQLALDRATRDEKRATTDPNDQTAAKRALASRESATDEQNEASRVLCIVAGVY
jgi:hypothetical protein